MPYVLFLHTRCTELWRLVVQWKCSHVTQILNYNAWLLHETLFKDHWKVIRVGRWISKWKPWQVKTNIPNRIIMFGGIVSPSCVLSCHSRSMCCLGFSRYGSVYFHNIRFSAEMFGPAEYFLLKCALFMVTRTVTHKEKKKKRRSSFPYIAEMDIKVFVAPCTKSLFSLTIKILY